MRPLFLILFSIPTLLFSTADWRYDQIKEDLDFSSYSDEKAAEYFEKKSDLIVRIEIKKRHVFYSIAAAKKKTSGFKDRFPSIHRALIELSDKYSLPDCTFYLNLEDASGPTPYPIFVMSKRLDAKNQILFPDFSALRKGYQVVKNFDVTKTYIPWENKASLLYWRGATTGSRPSDYEKAPRTVLCKLSRMHPDLIDAKFTYITKEFASIPEIESLRGEFVSYLDMFKQKYQVWIDGNAASYSDSCWRFFSNSAILKQNSEWTQWYFRALIPYVHYVPIHHNLSDLVEKLEWLHENDDFAKEIALNAYLFAKEHLTREKDLEYLYLLLCRFAEKRSS